MTWLISKILIENIKLEKKNYKHIDIYYVGYITIKEFDEYNKINKVKSFALDDSFCYRIY